MIITTIKIIIIDNWIQDIIKTSTQDSSKIKVNHVKIDFYEIITLNKIQIFWNNLQLHLEIIKNYYRNSESVVATLRALTPIFGRNNRPTRQTVRAIEDKFKTKFTLLDVPVQKDVVLLEAKKQSQP